MKFILLVLSGLSLSSVHAESPSKVSLNQKLDSVRMKKLALEKALVEAEKSKKSTEDQLKRLKNLQSLQAQEKALTEQRLQTLEKYLLELQTRKSDVEKRLENAKSSIQLKFSKIIHPLLAQNDRLIRGEEGEGERLLKEKIISGIAFSELKELEGLYADLQDAEDIESRIEQEKQQISSLMQDVSEQESLIRFHTQIRESLSSERHDEQIRQLEEYRKLKVSEVEIEKMISEFQGRQKLEEEQDQKRRIPMIAFKPHSLVWPLRGKLVGTYGQHRDERSGLNIFKKGIEILTIQEHSPVHAVLDGKVQYAGEIPGKGKVMIVEHAHSIYTIYGGLREISRLSGDNVKASEKLGFVDSGQPLYFEIRARNVAIDPAKWLQ